MLTPNTTPNSDDQASSEGDTVARRKFSRMRQARLAMVAGAIGIIVLAMTLDTSVFNKPQQETQLKTTLEE